MILIQIKWVDILHAYLHISMEMSSVKENSIKIVRTTFSMTRPISKILTQITSRQMENYAKIFLFTTLVM